MKAGGRAALAALARNRPASLTAGGVLAVGLWFAADRLLPQGAPLGLVAVGAVLGSATALVALGLILVYRANRIVNFAYGAMGGVAGIVSIQLFLTWGWNYFVSLAVGVVLGVGVGAATEVLAIRRFANSSRLVLTVATIGLAQLLGGIELLIPGRIFRASGIVIGGFPTPLSSVTIPIGPVLITGDHILIAAVVPFVVGGLAWFLSRSDAGIAVRAAAENADRARLLGIPVRRLHTLVWGIAGGMAALTFALKAPFLGATPDAVAGPTLLLPALAAAVVARMRSLPVAFAAGVGLGIVDQIVRWNTTTPSLVDVIFLAVILVALLVQHDPRSRAAEAGASESLDVTLVARVPAALRRLPEVKAATALVLAILAGAAIGLPLLLSPSTLNVMAVTAVWSMVAISLVVLTGWCGHISLGQFAFVGVGAVVAGNLLERYNADLFLALAAAGAATALVALVLGLPALRISGPFLAVVTLAFAVALDSFVLNPNNFPGWIPQEVTRPVLWQRFDLENELVAFYLCLAFLVLAVLVARGLRHGRAGRVLVGTRDNRRAAETMSVPTRRVALRGFVFAGTLAGVAGGLHVMLLHGARVGSYQPIQSIEVFSMAVIGGIGSIGGSVLGTFGLRTAQDAVSASVRLLLSGTGLLIILLVLPGGVVRLVVSVRDRLLRIVARRRRLAVPELVPTRRKPEPTAPTTTAPFTDLPGAPAAAAAEPLLSCRDIDASYGALQVLFGVDFTVYQGEIVALLGTNGAGKSTLLKSVCGLLPPDSGQITLSGDRILRLAPEAAARRGIALMPGGKGVFPTLTVAENLRLAAWLFRRDSRRVKSRIGSALERFPALGNRYGTLAGDLSGGEQQMLALAQAILGEPQLLLIDELSLGLAPIIIGELLEIVRAFNRTGTTIVVVEQSVNVALTLAERAVFMEKGEVRFSGPTAELLNRPDILRSVFLEGAAAFDGAAGEETRTADGRGDGTLSPDGFHDGGHHDPAVIASATLFDEAPQVHVPAARAARVHPNGQRPELEFSPPAPTEPDVVLACYGVTKRFGGINAVDGVDLGVRRGTIVGLVGQNGAGKTTLLDCISGFHDIDRGRIFFRGADVTEWPPHKRGRARLGRSFQEARLFPSLTVEETIATACERWATSRSFVADATRQPASYESELGIWTRVERLIDLLRLGDYAAKPTSQLSTGTRRIVELACLLAQDPILLLLDEPSAGVAQREAEALGPLLRRVRDHTRCGMLVVEHDMPLLSSICDQMVALELGAVIAHGLPADVLSSQAVVASYLGNNEAAIGRSGTAAAPVR